MGLTDEAVGYDFTGDQQRKLFIELELGAPRFPTV